MYTISPFHFSRNIGQCSLGYSGYSGYVHFCGLFDSGEDENPVTRQCCPPVEKMVAGRRNSLIVLASTRAILPGVGDVSTPGLVPPCTLPWMPNH